MMNTEQIKMSRNNLVAVGTLKSNGLVEGVDRNGKDYVRGDIVLEIQQEGGINEVKFNCFSSKGTKPYNNMKAAVDLLDKTKAIDPSMAERVRVVGSVELNEYVNDGEIVSFNRNSAAFIYPNSKGNDDIKVELESVITGKNETDEGLYLDVMYADYRGNVEVIKGGIRVPEHLAEQANQTYSEGDTAVLAFTISNSVKVVEDDNDTVAFGQVIQDTTTETEYILTGGRMPKKDGSEYSESEIARMAQLRKEQYEQLEASITPDISNFGNSGGGGFGSEGDNPFM